MSVHWVWFLYKLKEERHLASDQLTGFITHFWCISET